MLERYGPKIWDWVGPNIGGKYWDDPNKQHTDGSLLYSSIERAASTSAWFGLGNFILSLPIGFCGIWALSSNPAIRKTSNGAVHVLDDGGAILVCMLAVSMSMIACIKLVEDIRWTQLTPTMGADGTADDLYGDDDEDEEEDEAEEESNIVPFEEDSWGSAS